MKMKPEKEIMAMLTQIAEPMGIIVDSVECTGGSNPKINIYIDKDGIMDLDTCEKFHRAIDEPMDKLDPTFGEEYTLSVSSLGIDRPFRTEKDFLSHIGERIEVKLHSSIRGKKFYDGILMDYNKDNITLKVSDKVTFTIAHKNIVKANEYIDFD